MSLCVFLLSLHQSSSSVSVVFDFNVSLIDFAPVSPALLPDYAKRKEKSELLMDLCLCASFFFCLYHQD